MTRAVNGDVAPEPSTLRMPADSMYLSEVFIMRRPPPNQELLDAVREARREIFSTNKSEDALPRSPSPQLSPPPPTPPPTTAKAHSQTAHTSPGAAARMFVFNEHNLPPRCRHCNVFFVTFASIDCRHLDACFACTFWLTFFVHLGGSKQHPLSPQVHTSEARARPAACVPSAGSALPYWPRPPLHSKAPARLAVPAEWFRGRWQTWSAPPET